MLPSSLIKAIRDVARCAAPPRPSSARSRRTSTPILYADKLDDFRVGGSCIVRGGRSDDGVAVIAARITVCEAVAAADQLRHAIKVRVIDAYSVKSIDTVPLVDALRTSEGLSVSSRTTGSKAGSAVLAALAEANVAGEIARFMHLAVRQMPGSGKSAEMLDAVGISAKHIAHAVRKLAAFTTRRAR